MAYWVFMYLMAIITVVYRETIGNRRQKPACRAVSNNEPENFVQP